MKKINEQHFFLMKIRSDLSERKHVVICIDAS